MISISPVADRERLEALYLKSGVKFNEFSCAVAACDRDEVLGYCLFELYEKGITVTYLEPQEDIMLADGILRSALHVAAQRSAMDAHYSENLDEAIFENLGFILSKEDKSLDIDKLFGGCCCKK